MKEVAFIATSSFFIFKHTININIKEGFVNG